MAANPSKYTKDANIPVKSWRFPGRGVVGKKLMKGSRRYQIVFAFCFPIAATCVACALIMLLTSFTYPLGRQKSGSGSGLTKKTGSDTDPDRTNPDPQHWCGGEYALIRQMNMEGGWGGRIAHKAEPRLLNIPTVNFSKDDKNRSLYVFLPIL